MKKPVLTALILSGLLFLLGGCSNGIYLSPRTFTIFKDTGSVVEGNPSISIPQTGLTRAIPDSYITPAVNQGAVIKLTYSSKDYAGDGKSITKPAYVYLPYGYNERDTKTKYNIFYMMHGLECTADQLFNDGGGMAKNMLDNMIANGDIPPLIVVAATFDAENSPQGYSRSVSEVRQFHQDFKNDLMPAVEGRFHTYAKSTELSDLEASREHRAFGGFSLGSVTTWMQFCYNYDYIKYFAPMSGSCWYFGGLGDYYPKETCDFFEKLITENKLNERGYFIYACTGTNDTLQGQMNVQMNEMLSRKDFFTQDHVVYYKKMGGLHDFPASVEYIYNALPVFFN